MKPPDGQQVVAGVRQALTAVVAPALVDPYAAKQLAIACMLLDDVCRQWEGTPMADERRNSELESFLRDAVDVLRSLADVVESTSTSTSTSARSLAAVISEVSSAGERSQEWTDQASAALARLLAWCEDELAVRASDELDALRMRGYAVAFTL